MNRPILVAVIGYIIGIIMGLYFKKSIVFFYSIILLITIILKIRVKYKNRNMIKRKFKIFRISRYLRYLKLYLNIKNILIIIIFSIISNTIILIKNERFNNLYNSINDVESIVIIVSSKQEKEYNNIYKAKVILINNLNKYKNTQVYIKTKKNKEFKYGDIVFINGKFKQPEVARNYGGFSYKNYLKTLNIFGTIEVNKIKLIEKQSEVQKILSYIEQVKIKVFKFFYDIREQLIQKANEFLKGDVYSIYSGLILGDTTHIEEKIYEQFSSSNMLHILAVSGMHISYIILGIDIIFKNIIGKRKTYIITIIFLIIYLIIAGFSPSIFRACIMGIIHIFSKLIYRKNDTCTSIAISLLILLIYNPFLITSIGFQYTYAGTLGIILFNKNILKLINNRKNKASKLNEIIAISLSSQLFLLPLTLYHFNTIGIYFLVTNIFLGFIICPVIILCFIFAFVIMLNLHLFDFLSIILSFLIKLIIYISNIGKLPFSKIYLTTPSIIGIIIYYLAVISLNLLYCIKNKNKLNATNIRILQTIQVCKYKFRTLRKSLKFTIKNIIILSSIIIYISSTMLVFFKYNQLEIFFIDVGQGDSCFIKTSQNKTILIDGGGSESTTFDIGKKTLIPYILDRGYNKIDYVIISHFDSDHVGGLLTVMEELDVGIVVISKQGENSKNYEKFNKIVKEKNIKVVVVGKGDRVKIDKDLYFDILWPNKSKLISENILNNNSIVCKLYYKNFSMLFTGDIEEIAEKQILQEYMDNLEVFNSTILKVGHHGSKTSSIQEFLDVVKPKLSLIGVGKNNKFGHPNAEVIKRFKSMRDKSL